MDKYLLRTSSTESLSNKRPAEDTIWRKPKRTITNPKRPSTTSISISNRFGGLEDDSDYSQGEISQKLSKPNKSGRIPPIVVDLGKDLPHKSVSDLVNRFTKEFYLQYRPTGKVAIHCYTNESHKMVVEGLRLEKNIHFHTFTRKEERKYKVVIRGVPNDAIDLVGHELAKLGFNEVTLTKLKGATAASQTSCSPLLVQLPAGTDIVKFKQIKYLCNCVIQIERFKPNNKFGTQCYRCQRFGHASKNCNLPERCVKCVGVHATQDCSKKDRTTPAQCCNCNESHPANYRQCPARVQYLQRLQQKAQKIQKPSLQIGPAAEKTTGRPQPSTRSWANVLASPKAPKPSLELENVPSSGDADTLEMLQILNVIKKIKKDFAACTTMMDKVILVLTHLGQYV